ncbi:hypothetical protein AB4072_04995 [Microvirga sp. 2MCAF38]|uniref:hypothetical protein n=1 Tax=Microvirga sp. 2MCAF38 TaxID=3232989 RepID=UPI003F96810B
MSGIKSLSAAVPSPAIALVTSWADLFVKTKLTDPEWSSDAEALAIAIGAAIAIALSLLVSTADKQRLKQVAWRWLYCAGAMLLACLALRYALGWSFGPFWVGILQPLWELAFVLGFVSFMIAMVYASLYVTEASQFGKIAIAVAMIAILLAGIAWGAWIWMSRDNALAKTSGEIQIAAWGVWEHRPRT